MKEIFKNFYVGTGEEFEEYVYFKADWAVVHAAKEPWHRKLLGYTTKAAPKDHPEYLMARRNLVLFLNLVDVKDPVYIKDEIINAALDFIGEHLAQEKKVFIHCNQGQSRAPSIAFLYLVRIGELTGKLPDMLAKFKVLYPNYLPSDGMRLYIEHRLHHRL